MQDDATGKRMLLGIVESLYGESWTEEGDEFDMPFLSWSDIVSTPRSPGQKLGDYVLACKLGDVWVSPERANPNSSNSIRIWVWTIAHTKLEEWVRKVADK